MALTINEHQEEELAEHLAEIYPLWMLEEALKLSEKNKSGDEINGKQSDNSLSAIKV